MLILRWPHNFLFGSSPSYDHPTYKRVCGKLLGWMAMDLLAADIFCSLGTRHRHVPCLPTRHVATIGGWVEPSRPGIAEQSPHSLSQGCWLVATVPVLAHSPVIGSSVILGLPNSLGYHRSSEWNPAITLGEGEFYG